MTHILATLQQNGTYSCSGLSSFINPTRYQNNHVVNVQQMFPLRQGVCLISEKMEGQLTHRNAILTYAPFLKRIISRSCAVLIEGPLGGCVILVVSFFSVLLGVSPCKMMSNSQGSCKLSTKYYVISL